MNQISLIKKSRIGLILCSTIAIFCFNNNKAWAQSFTVDDNSNGVIGSGLNNEPPPAPNDIFNAINFSGTNIKDVNNGILQVFIPNNVNALSAGFEPLDAPSDFDGFSGIWDIKFSVSPNSQGLFGSDVNLRTIGNGTGGADIFWTGPTLYGSNRLSSTDRSLGLLRTDNLDGMEVMESRVGANEIPYQGFSANVDDVYFSITGSGDIYQNNINNPFRTFGQLGLQLGDDIDALALDIEGGGLPFAGDGLVEALFSLAPGSPSLDGPDGIPGNGDDYSSADILYTSFNNAFNLANIAPNPQENLGNYPGPLNSAGLGLRTTDNLDGLDILFSNPEPFCLLPMNNNIPIGGQTACSDDLSPKPERPLQTGPTENKVIPPEQVPGKEYSNNGDINDLGNDDPEQNLNWDNGVNDTFDFSDSRQFDPQEQQVDALAHANDHLFAEVIANAVPLLFSTDEDERIFYEETNGSFGLWAIPPLATDVDGLEIWGPNNQDDGDVYSIQGDPLLDDPSGLNGGVISGPISVWIFDENTDISQPILFATDIANAVNPLFPDFEIMTENIDLDAMMMSESNLLFSLIPIDGNNDGNITPNDPTQDLDGGEIFVWNGQPGQIAQFLSHGEHLWNTNFDVMGTFGTTTENINALEAVASTPESSSTISILALGILGGSATLKRKLKSANSTEK